uniref:F-box protein At4g18380-like n=1 Tax=Erigeron canadensis TaxID=72917 RepID=UPI001CB94EDA|nr:F-box protein At4g18380-like [Erigeron canadensis]
MMSSLLPDLTTSKIYPEPPPPPPSFFSGAADRFDYLPDSLILLIFNRIGDVKSLGRCSAVSRRFQTLIPQIENVVVRVDCVISDDDPSTASSSADKSRSPISSLFRIFFSGFVKPFQSLGQLFNPKRLSPPSALTVGNIDGGDDLENGDGGGVTHHSPTQVLKNFNEIKFLKIELPAGELGVEDDVLLRWKADFGSTLDNCVMLGASSVIYPDKNASNQLNYDTLCIINNTNAGNVNVNDDNGSIPESFYTNGGLKLRVVWTISSLIAASARHYLLQPIIAEHKTLDSLVLTDADGQGVLCMNREQLEELRVKPLSASSASKRTLVPALNMRLWYAPYLELPDGTVLKGATLVATRPSDQLVQREVADGLWVSSAFEEPFGTAAKMLLKRRTYCLEMNSF